MSFEVIAMKIRNGGQAVFFERSKLSLDVNARFTKINKVIKHLTIGKLKRFVL